MVEIMASLLCTGPPDRPANLTRDNLRPLATFEKQIVVIMIISIVNVRELNLNLLVSFDALLAEENVTRAARRVGLTQSAMSNALAQLRQVFDDPLFTRRPGGMAPTQRALALGGAVRQALATLDMAFAAVTRFDPSSAERTFTITTSDYGEYVLLPPLLRLLQREAPNVRVGVRAWGLHEVPGALKEGTADLMVGFYSSVPPGHREELLFDEDYVCLVRKGHPRVRTRLTLKQYLELSHVLVSQQPESAGSVDRALSKMGHSRKVGVRVSHFLMVPSLVAQTDMIAALSRRVAEPFAKILSLRLFPPPIALPAGRIGQVWHARTDADPAHVWFRDVVRRVAARV
jgi:DNA-binding transcriptional LysR family regulator